MVALVYEVDQSQLVARTRGRKNIAFARQVAMYLAHTTEGLSLSDVGRLFGRDRTTVAHGCALVEDARDDMTFDRSLSHLESAISCQMDLFRSISQSHASTNDTYAGPRV
ncbi:MAG: chromosomal replication initiator DnaA [bacterium]|nr:chromosomal replication initiator DnaA [bacterium]